MSLRNVALASAIIGIPLSLLILALPITWGYGGYDLGPASSSHNGQLPLIRMISVDPGGPAWKAGLRSGDLTEKLSAWNGIASAAGPVGTVIDFKVLRGIHLVTIPVRFVAFPPGLAVQERVGKAVSALVGLGAFIVTLLVGFRARDRRSGARAVVVLASAAWLAAAHAGELVAPWVVLAFIGSIAPPFLGNATSASAMWLLAAFPPNPTRVRTLIAQSALWLFGLSIALSLLRVLAVAGSIPPAYTAYVLSFVVGIAMHVLLAPACVDAMVTAAPAYRTAVRWLGGCWLLAAVLGALLLSSEATGIGSLGSHHGDAFFDAITFLLAFGVAYPVLRHRLVDLNFVVTRASAFAIVSLVILAIFVVVEWFISVLFERSFGVEYAQGVWPQALTLATVLVLGISARSIHRLVEGRLGQVFFRKKLKGIARITRVAREADVSTDARSMMELACETAASGLEALGVACYLRRGEAYALAASSGAIVSPPMYDFNDATPLRLRRWQEPFELDDDSDERNHMLFLPMALRGELLGFLCCGPKPDRTPYLKDEINALALLAHQVGIATAWLEPAATGLRPAVSSAQPVLSS